jgi:hypothetical protein
LAISVPSASASVIGHLSVGICGPSGGESGGVTVSSSAINWSPGSPSACLQVGGATNITSGAGPLTGLFSGTGTINDLTLPFGSDPLIAGFMTFTGGGLTAPLKFDLAPSDGFGPGSFTSCAIDPGVNNSCSIPLGLGVASPFILTETISNTGVLGTFVGLNAHGTIVDPVDGILSYWSGAFTTQINGQTPSQIQAIILTPGGSIHDTFSGGFDVSPVPEPVSMALIGGGLLALAAIKRRKRV